MDLGVPWGIPYRETNPHRWIVIPSRWDLPATRLEASKYNVVGILHSEELDFGFKQEWWWSSDDDDSWWWFMMMIHDDDDDDDDDCNAGGASTASPRNWAINWIGAIFFAFSVFSWVVTLAGRQPKHWIWGSTQLDQLSRGAMKGSTASVDMAPLDGTTGNLERPESLGHSGAQAEQNL